MENQWHFAARGKTGCSCRINFWSSKNFYSSNLFFHLGIFRAYKKRKVFGEVLLASSLDTFLHPCYEKRNSQSEAKRKGMEENHDRNDFLEFRAAVMAIRDSVEFDV